MKFIGLILCSPCRDHDAWQEARWGMTGRTKIKQQTKGTIKKRLEVGIVDDLRSSIREFSNSSNVNRRGSSCYYST